MGWDNITGEAKIIPSSGGGNEVKFESGKPKRLRLALRQSEQPYSYLEHTLENEVIENGQTVKYFRTIRCPKTTKNPNAQCKICDGQKLKRRARNAANAWDFDLGQIQKLNGGEKIWLPIATAQKMGVDPMSVNWGVLKTGESRNDIDYAVTNLGPSEFQIPDNAQYFDIEAEYAPHTEAEAKAIVEECKMSWDDVITPPVMEYPKTIDEALNHIMPNGKYKGQTFKAMWESDPSPKGMINFLATKSDRVTYEKACAQCIMVTLGGAHIPGVPNLVNGTVTPQPTPTTTTPTQPPPPLNGDRQGKINQINQLIGTKDKFVKDGFEVVIKTLKEAGNGKQNIVDFTDQELDKMLELCNK